MLTRWGIDRELDQAFSMLNELQRGMNRVFEEFGLARPELGVARFPELFPWRTMNWPPANLYDVGNEVVVKVEVPGLSEKDFQISASREVLTIAGERKAEVPEGYSVHRQERGGDIKFSRSFTLPCPIDMEKVSATVKNGILTVTCAKTAEAQPRQIPVKVQ